jgi:hypothetical protein
MRVLDIKDFFTIGNPQIFGGQIAKNKVNAAENKQFLTTFVQEVAVDDSSDSSRGVQQGSGSAMETGSHGVCCSERGDSRVVWRARMCTSCLA